MKATLKSASSLLPGISSSGVTFSKTDSLPALENPIRSKILWNIQVSVFVSSKTDQFFFTSEHYIKYKADWWYWNISFYLLEKKILC